ncbi:MAG: hypothetical protein ACO3CD_04625 [Candidatus Nanopelagicaceae bacterium]|jgi:hypothetical protein
MEENNKKPKKGSKYKDVVARMKAAVAKNKRQDKINKLDSDSGLWKNLT